MDFFLKIIKCNAYPTYDTYMNCLILIITHEILIACLNSFSLALLDYFIVLSYQRQKNLNISCSYVIPSVSSLPALLRSNLKQSNRWEYLYVIRVKKNAYFKHIQIFLVDESKPLMPCMKTYWAGNNKILVLVLVCDAKQQTWETAKIKLVLWSLFKQVMVFI